MNEQDPPLTEAKARETVKENDAATLNHYAPELYALAEAKGYLLRVEQEKGGEAIQNAEKNFQSANEHYQRAVVQYCEMRAMVEKREKELADAKAEIERLRDSIRRLDEDEKHDHQFAQDALDLEKALKASEASRSALEEREKKLVALIRNKVDEFFDTLHIEHALSRYKDGAMAMSDFLLTAVREKTKDSNAREGQGEGA